MPTHKCLVLPIVVMLLIMTIGCNEDENQRLADMADRHQERQAEQSRQVLELQHEVAEGARRLVAADAQAREELVTLQRAAQTQRAEVDRQRDLLEDERRRWAAIQRLDPIIAAALTNVGLLLACLLPLVLGLYLLRRPVEPADDRAVAEILLQEIVATEPLLLPPRENGPPDGEHNEEDAPRLPDNSGRRAASD